MSKYDFGYIMKEGTTNKWAFDVIQRNSTVLELGPAVGNLTKHLFEEKECAVDIVELDDEAGMEAQNFAREAIIGDCKGNLNKDLWYELLKKRKYDYIIALDVLEHLENPKHVLVLLKELLNDRGKIVLSIPNVAHNAIILELLKNEFPYSDLGLLDKTHVHFFSYNTVIQMVQEVGLHITLIDSIQKVIGDTEFNCSYTELPIEVEHYLRTRKNGDVYQFLLVLEKEKGELINHVEEGILEDSLYESKVLVDGLLKNLVSVKSRLDYFDINVNIKDYPNASSLRIIPVEGVNAIVNLGVYAFNEKNEKIELDMNWTTGIKVDNHTVILSTAKNEINYLLEEDFRSAYIEGNCILINDTTYQTFGKQMEKFDLVLNNKEMQMQEFCSVINEKEAQIQELSKEINLSQSELNQIKNTRIYKLFSELLGMKRKDYKKNNHG